MRDYNLRDFSAALTQSSWSDDKVRKWDLGADHALTVNLTGLTAQETGLARAALAEWSTISGIRFIETTGGAELTYVHTGTKATTRQTASGDYTSSATVEIPQSKVAPGDTIGSYVFRTYMHETGHALGLSHPQDYGTVKTPDLGEIRNDSWQLSVMSYFSQVENSYVNATKAYPITPMSADVLAISIFYGAPGAVRAGNTTYGDNSTAGGALDQLSALGADAAFTLVDTSGIDSISLKSATAAQLIDLRPGSFSNVLGATGNMSIMPGTIIENATGGGGNDQIIGNDAANILDGFLGNDTLIGGTGNDTYITDGLDRIVEATGQGTDHVISSGSITLGANIERLTLSGKAAINAIGNDDANQITGNAGANVLDGRGGVDTLTGGAGNDTYITDGRDRIFEAAGGGVDLVRSSVSLALGANLENLTLSGDAANAIGNTLSNRLVGNDKANVLDGRTGQDFLFGGKGNDTYVTDGGDRIGEAAGAGIDRVISTAAVVLAPNLEIAQLRGNAAVNVVGNDIDNIIVGNGAANVLSGRGGNDRLTGGGGADSFVFDGGKDVVADFQDNVDTLRLDNALWNSASRSIDEALSHARVAGGNVVFDFDGGNRLVVLGVNDLDLLRDDLLVV
ncbi:M10 family metallopeptidase C-terminal domain-containing protein [Paracoccus pacificus]|uniref:M10 family metallopeptidase C-terminal domain-containing protein n=1 Tax=Paracoccus pacificus TaxID=1463598 RepID=A0ABW4R2P6_9RHOB